MYAPAGKGDAPMVSTEKQYEFIAGAVNDRARATYDGLKIFLPTFSAIVGGTIWLRHQINTPIPVAYEYLSNVLVLLLTLISTTMVMMNLHSWRGYRKKLTELTAGSDYPAPPPVLFPSAIMEGMMCLAMILACGLFVIFNPFGIPK